MKVFGVFFPCVWVGMVVLGMSGLAKAQEEPAELTALRVHFEEKLKDSVLPVMRSYGRALRDKMTESTKAGKLDEALAFKEEMERVAREIMAANKAGLADTGRPEPGPRTRPVARRTTIDFLEIINVGLDGKPAVKWAMDDGKLLCVRGSMVPKVILPYEPPEEFDMEMTFEQPRLRNGLSFIIPNGAGSVFSVCAAESSGMMAGLSVGGKYDPTFCKTKAGWFRPDREYTLRVEVRKDSVKGMVDGKEVFTYEGDRSALETIVWLKHPQVTRLAISADDPAVITKLEVTEVSGTGKLLRK